MSRRVFLSIIVLIVLGGFAVRTANQALWRPLVERRPTPVSEVTPRNANALVLGSDAGHYHFQALALAKGDGYVEGYSWRMYGDTSPSALHPPAYATYLAAWTVLGVESAAGHRFVGSLLGIVTMLAAAATATALFGRRAGIAAAGIAAFLPDLWINDTSMFAESLAQASVAVFLFALVKLQQRRDWRWAVVAGLAGGVATLTRNELFLLLGILVAVLLLQRGHRIVDSLRLAGVAVLAAGVLVTPWVVRNLVSFRNPVILTSASGSALSAASCDGVYYGPGIGWYSNCVNPDFLTRTLPSGQVIKVDAAGRRLDETEWMRPYDEQANAYIRSHLRRLPVVMTARVGRLWGWFRPAGTTDLEILVESRGIWQSKTVFPTVYVLEALGVAGLVIMRRRRIPLLAPIAVVAVATFGAAITFGIGRYRSTAEVALVVPAAIACVVAWTAMSSVWHRRGNGPAGVQAEAGVHSITGASE
jgi:hypothetical protein